MPYQIPVNNVPLQLLVRLAVVLQAFWFYRHSGLAGFGLTGF